MKNESDDNLEKLIHRELAKLSELEAPSSLIPAVLSALRNQPMTQWWRQPWFRWPTGPRVISLAFAAVLLSAVFAGGAIFWDGIVQNISTGAVNDWLAPFQVVEVIVGSLANAALIVLGAIGKFWMFLTLAIVLTAYVSFVGIGTVCVRLAINKR